MELTSFECAAKEIKAAGIEGRVVVSDTHKLQLYALFKQATVGDCCVPAPSAFRVVEHAKWSSWHKLVGTQQSDAKRRYVELVKTLLPGFQETTAAPAAIQEQTIAETPRQPKKVVRPKPQRGLMVRLLYWLMVAGAVLFVIIKLVLPWGRHFTADQVLDEALSDEELEQTLSSLSWFAVGYCLVVLLRSKLFPWPEYPGVSPAAVPCVQSQGRRRRQRRVPAERKLDTFLRTNRIKVIHSTQPKDGETTAPRLQLTLPDDPEAFEFGDCKTTIPYTVEQTADVYYRKFKEPLPDPASRLLDSIEVLEERHLDEYCAVFKRRLLRFRNESSCPIKRFVSSDYIEYIEDSLLDKQNRLFYVYVKNESFQSLGVLEDFSVYKAHSDKPHWTNLHQFCRVHITSSSLSFFRSKIESLISSYYCENAPDARMYHLQRIKEEFGDYVEN